jgi:hypothetical protein
MAIWVRNKQTQALVLVVGEDTVARVLAEPDRYERLPDAPAPIQNLGSPTPQVGAAPNTTPEVEDPELKAMMEPPADWKPPTPAKRTRGSKA